MLLWLVTRNSINDEGIYCNLDENRDVSVEKMQIKIEGARTSRPQDARHIHPSSTPCLMVRMTIFIEDVVNAIMDALYRNNHSKDLS